MTVDTPDLAPILSAERISKSFGEVPVLFGVNFDVRPGEVHALIGENGAGKSTLMKILAGFLQPNSGGLLLRGKKVTLPPNGEAEKLGIVLIHQEFNLVNKLTIEENIFLGREITKNGLLQHKEMKNQTRAILNSVGLNIDPDTRIEDLTIATQQLIEIAKAINRNTQILIMDEPTAVLTSNETEVFFRQVEILKKQGVAIIFISHKLDEVVKLADRVTVLRDGKWVASRNTEDLTPNGMAQLMVGRELSDLFPPTREPDTDSETVLELRNICIPDGAQDINLFLKKGEILGMSGLVGSGRTSVFEGVMGLQKVSQGDILLQGRKVSINNPVEAVNLGLSYLTKDRKQKGLLLDSGLKENITLLALKKCMRFGLINEKIENRMLERAKRRFDIRANSANMLVRNLSGGNQQKVLLAKVMEVDPSIIIIDEPTRGIDVGTKQQIYHFIAALAANGKSIVLISSEMPEIIGLSHRVIVMHNNRITGVLEGQEIQEEEIMYRATGLLGTQKTMEQHNHV